MLLTLKPQMMAERTSRKRDISAVPGEGKSLQSPKSLMIHFLDVGYTIVSGARHLQSANMS